MTWFKVDDGFHSHPKMVDASDAAVALWTRAGSWASAHLTDGFVPSGMPARFCGDPDAAAEELISRGVWTRTRGGFQFHDWLDYNPSKEKVLTDRAKEREKKRRMRAALAKKRGQTQPPGRRRPDASPKESPRVSPGDTTGDTRRDAEPPDRSRGLELTPEQQEINRRGRELARSAVGLRSRADPDCDSCRGRGWVCGPDGQPVQPARRCPCTSPPTGHDPPTDRHHPEPARA